MPKIVLAIAATLIATIMLTSLAFDAIVKMDEARDCERWARQYGHDYCND